MSVDAIAAADRDRAERAADAADRRARDADRIVRWGVALILGAMLILAYQVAGLSGRVDTLAAAVQSLVDSAP